MERNDFTPGRAGIEKLPFFEGFYGKGKAIVDIKSFEEWLNETQGSEFLNDEDEIDRREAFEELEKGESLDLLEATKEW
jgi:hypothetical protein